MKRLPSSFLLAFAYCAVTCHSASSDKLVVKQTPDVSVMEGEMVNITCCWTENIGRVHVNWLKSETQNKEDLYMNSQSQVFQKKEENYCSTLTFPSISREDAGRYICRVTIEIPVLTIAHGDGTVITVRDPHQDEVLIHLLRCLPILTLILAFFTLYYLGTKAQKQALAAPGNEPTSAQRREEGQEEEEEREEGVIEAADESHEAREENNGTI